MDKEKHFRLLGWLFVIYGILTAVLILLIAFRPEMMRGDQEQHAALAIALTSVVAAFYIVTGWALTIRKPWARTLAIIASVLVLFNFPFGTALGIYGLWVLFSAGGREAYTGGPETGSETPQTT